MKIHYTVKLSKPHAHTFCVSLELSQADKNGQRLSLPAWIPGSYMIRDFAKNINNIQAFSDNKQVALEKLDKSTWQVAPVTGPLLVTYEVYAWDLSVRSAHFDMTHAFFNGTSLFLMPHGLQNSNCTIAIEAPAGSEYSFWKATTTLSKHDVDASGFGTYQAPNYDDLIDHPVEIGTHSEFDFLVVDTPHKMTLSGIHRADSARLKQDLTKICQTHCSMFGEIPDLKEYVFLTMVTGDGYGGLEHRSSTSLMCSRGDLPLTNHPTEPDEKYRNFLSLCSHEYFHTWNIKRIKPEAFIPYDLSCETYTRQLWAFEGITSYYDELALVRSGVISLNSYLELIGQTITRVLRGKGRFSQSLAESSFDAWTKFYKQDENAPNAIVSYYTKGALLALCLDLTIRKNTNNDKSLDDVMRHLWNNYGKNSRGVPEGEIKTISSDIAGVDLTSFFEIYLYGVEDLPLADLLSGVGINFNLRQTTSLDDKGGNAATVNNENPAFFGAQFTDDAIGTKITQVYTGGSAEQAGLSAGDIVIAVNDLRINKASIDKTLNSYRPNEELTIHAFRRDELKMFNVKLKKSELTTCYLQVDKMAKSDVRESRNIWLHIK
jgi:predicted metalloprotease with PDZ domain